MVELYKIKLRCGRSAPTGAYETTRIGTKRAVNKFREFYQTDLGELTPEKWKEALMKAIVNDKELDTLEAIKEHCRENCMWLHSDKEVEEYAMEILAGRVFLCGNENWKDVADKVGNRYILFTFMEGERDGFK
jgi:hypothetical protein